MEAIGWPQEKPGKASGGAGSNLLPQLGRAKIEGILDFPRGTATEHASLQDESGFVTMCGRSLVVGYVPETSSLKASMVELDISMVAKHCVCVFTYA